MIYRNADLHQSRQGISGNSVRKIITRTDPRLPPDSRTGKTKTPAKYRKHQIPNAQNRKDQTNPVQQKTPVRPQTSLRDKETNPEMPPESPLEKIRNPYLYIPLKTLRRPFITPKNNHIISRKNVDICRNIRVLQSGLKSRSSPHQ